MDQTEILAYYGEPSPYSMAQEIYLDFLPIESYIDSGVWKIRLIPKRIVQGSYNMWLPGGKVLNRDDPILPVHTGGHTDYPFYGFQDCYRGCL